MFRRLWLRWVLWVNNYCPRHGQKTQSLTGGSHYCPECLAEKRKADVLRLAAHGAILIQYYKELGEK